MKREAWSSMVSVRRESEWENRRSGVRARILEATKRGEVSWRLGQGETWNAARGLHLILRIWGRSVRYLRQHRILRAIRLRRRKLWEGNLERDIEKARRDNDARKQWQLMRILGGTGKRTRKRDVRAVRRDDPGIEDWATAMKKTGGGRRMCRQGGV